MKTKAILATFAGAVGIAAYVWRDERYRDKIVTSFENVKQRFSGQTVDETKVNHLLEKAGNPDPYDTEDNTMVSEGAVYSINYYNEYVQQ